MFYIDENGTIVKITKEFIINEVVYRWEIVESEKMINGEFTLYKSYEAAKLAIGDIKWADSK